MMNLVLFEDAYAVLEIVSGPSRTGWYQVICPAHSDERPSLGILERPDGTLGVNCLAGCSQKDVYDAILELLG